MTTNQKRRITLMRQNPIGCAAVVSELKLPLSTAKAFCQRNGLEAGDLARDTQIDNIAEASPGNDLISLGGCENRTAAKRQSAWRIRTQDL